ncbi:MAG: 50S ribosomal protein L32 [Patescibacteria group bacterium]
MTVRMRHTRGHTGNRRSHHALTESAYTACSACGALRLKHHMCEKCGMYRGRIVIDMKAKGERQLKRRQEKMKAMGEPTSKAKQESSSDAR